MELIVSCGFLLLGSLSVLMFADLGIFNVLAALLFFLSFIPLVRPCLRFWAGLWKKYVLSDPDVVER